MCHSPITSNLMSALMQVESPPKDFRLHLDSIRAAHRLRDEVETHPDELAAMLVSDVNSTDIVPLMSLSLRI